MPVCGCVCVCIPVRNLGSSWSRRGRPLLGSWLWPLAWVNPSPDWRDTQPCWKNWRDTWRLASVCHFALSLTCADTQIYTYFSTKKEGCLCFIFSLVCFRTNILTELTSTLAWWPLKALQWVKSGTVFIKTFLRVCVHPCAPECLCVCVCVQAQCQEVRKKKDLELQILTEPIRNWEGDDIRTLGPVLHMSQATVHTQNCQVLKWTTLWVPLSLKTRFSLATTEPHRSHLWEGWPAFSDSSVDGWD